MEILLSEQPTVKHPNGFEATVKPHNGLYYLTMKTTSIPVNARLDISEAEHGIKAVISPVTMLKKDNDRTPTYMTNNVHFHSAGLKITDEQ